MPGAIWGVVSDVNAVQKASLYAFETFQNTYKMNFFSEHVDNRFILRAATVNLKTPDVSDLPIYVDSKTGICVIADAILDNRVTLMKMLEVTESRDYTDSELIFLAYSKWGSASAKYLVGDFAFVVIDGNKVFCARDPMGIRTLYYRFEDGIFRFGTLMRSVFDQTRDLPTFHEGWLVDFMAVDGILHQIRENETLYEGIYFLEPAHTLVIDFESANVQTHRYWWPEGVLPVFKSQEAAYEVVREAFVEAVKCRVDVSGPIGVMLSGGLDSTSVAAVACSLLSGSDQLVHGFTSVPEYAIEVDIPNIAIDESEFVKLLADRYPNLMTHILAFEGRNAYEVSDELLDVLEMPYKFVKNSHWVYPILDDIKSNGCNLVLTGSYGNGFYSSGSRRYTMARHLAKMNLKPFRSLWSYYKGVGFTSAELRRRLFNDMVPRDFRAFYRKIKKGHINDLSGSAVKSDWLKKYDVDRRIHKAYCNELPINPYSKSQNQLMLSSYVLNHMNELEVKTGLAKGLIVRDPTIDKRLIEVICAIPPEFLCDDVLDRKIPRVAMEAFLPEAIRNNLEIKGFQGADWILRLGPRLKDVVNEMDTLIASCNLKSIDVLKLKNRLDSIDLVEPNPDEVAALMRDYLVLKFYSNAQQKGRIT